MLQTPVLFLIFNRPDTTALVFEEIRKAAPLRLYVAADGPRRNKDNEAELCEKTRAILKNVDWPCEIKSLFREENLGCKKAVSSALDWFFRSETEGIILEDDCLPHFDFFSFCSDMLARYREDERIMHIAGINFQFGRTVGQGSYYFSRINHIWGWASWRRAWEHYDVDMKAYPSFKQQYLIKNIFRQSRIQKFWINVFDKLTSGKIDTWDYQWAFAMWINSGLSIIPNKNLVSNIGFETGGTHAKDKGNIYANIPRVPLRKIIHPEFIIDDIAADERTLNMMHNPSLITYVLRHKLKLLK